MSALLELRGLCAGYGRSEVVRNIDLAVMPGEVVSVIGPNGAGKTTFLAGVMNLLPTPPGSVRFDGVALDKIDPEARIALGLVLVPERRELFADMTVEDNLRLGGYLRLRRRDRAVASDLERIYSLFPVLLERRRQIAKTLSGGEQQMLAIGRALMGRPRLLLLDEPSTGLAPRMTASILAAIERMKTEWSLSVLLVEQNARLALSMSDRAYVMETGEFILDGRADEIRHDPRIVESYLGGAERYAS